MSQAEVFASIIKARRSVRAYLPKPVDEQTLQSVFELAQRAPSNCNTQPWTVAVVSGAKLDRLRERLPKAFSEQKISMDFPYEGKYEGVFKERQYDAARVLYDSMGIERSDKAGRTAQFMRNFSFFDAPHCVLLFLPEVFGLREAADVGMYAQNLMLSMVAHGLGCVPQTALGFFAVDFREELGIDPSQKLLFGISFGYEDPQAPENKAWTSRAALDEAVQFYS